MTTPTESDVRPGTSLKDGGCNGCTVGVDAITAGGVADYPITVVRLRGSEFRLCAGCRSALRKLLT